MSAHHPIQLITYCPKSGAGREELARRTAQAHADAVLAHLRQLSCPGTQKIRLLDAVTKIARERAAGQ